MRHTLFGLAWSFIFLAAAYDAHFAWEFRDDLQLWEMNPIACWAVQAFGLLAVFSFKFGSLTFAAAVAVYCWKRQRRLQWLLTMTITSVYALLAIQYVLIFQQPLL